jgi:probable phosphoglycerate mutase
MAMVILVRHGRTAFNEEGRIQGASDSPLTPVGLDQARRVGALIGGLVTAEVTLWSSPLGRTMRTAQIIKDVAALTCPVKIDGRLREVSLGSWDGLTQEDIETVSPGACDGATLFDWFFRSPDGESFEAAEARLRDWLEEVLGLPGCHVAVSHGLSGRILRGAYLAMPKAEALKLDSPQDSVFRLSGGSCELIVAPA